MVSLDKYALQVLLSYNWPGNVRELENTIERLVIMTGVDKITPSELPVSLSLKPSQILVDSGSLSANVEEIEKANILESLEKTGWNQSKAARLLGITPRQIGYKIRKYKLNSTEL